MFKHSTSNLVVVLFLCTVAFFNLAAQNQGAQTLHGYVHAQGFPGHTLSNTEVVITNVWTQEVKKAYTDNDGYYELSLNANDTYTIAAHKNQYTSMVTVIDLREHHARKTVEQDIPIELPASATRLPQETCILQGKVRLQTEDKSTVPNVQVTLLNTETEKEQVVRTDESGFFQFSVSNEGDFTLYATQSSAFSDVQQMSMEGCMHPQKIDLYLHMAESTSNKKLTKLVNDYVPVKPKRPATRKAVRD